MSCNCFDPLDLGYVIKSGPIIWSGIDYSHSVGDYVRNKAGTVTGEIVAKDKGQAWVRVRDYHHVTVNLSDLEPAPKPLQVGDRVRLKQFPDTRYEIRAIENGHAFLKNLSFTDSYGHNPLDGLERA